MTDEFLTEGRRSFLLALARRMVPESAQLGPDGERRFFEIIEKMLATRPRAMLRQLALFLFVLRWLPLFLFFGRLDKLPAAKADRALRFFEGFPVLLIRKGFWGVKTLVFMGYYGQVEVWERIGYRPSRTEGNAKLHA
jgi:hypothetical protein